jgi:hypothetical protein
MPCAGNGQQLDQDGAVALQRIRARRAAMGQVPQDRQRLRYDRVALLALDVGNEAKAARIALMRGIVQALPRRRPTRRSFRSVLHHDLTRSTWHPGGIRGAGRGLARERAKPL